jgi:hypothetical protein
LSFWLPKLMSGNDVDRGSGLGWIKDKNNVALDRICKGLDVAKIGAQNVESIPSMWARATLFEVAVLSEKSNNRSEVDLKLIGEWRGTLALLAFADLFQFNLNYIQIDFDREACLTKFRNQIPRNSILKNMGWETIYLITYNNVPFAFTSPTTLVCTGTEYKNILSREIKWFNGEYLVDPCGILTQLHKKLLAFWLLNLKKSIAGYSDTNTESILLKSILDMLDGFMSDLGYGTLETQAVHDPNQYNTIKPVIRHGFYEMVSQPLVYKDDSSSIMLKGISNRKILLYTDRMLNVEDHHVMVYGALTLDSLKHSKISEHMIGSQSLGQCSLYRGEDWLFNEEVYLIDEEKMQPDYQVNYPLCWDINGFMKNVMIVYPFRDVVLEHLSIDCIKENTRVETIQSGNDRKICVKITLELSGGRQEFSKVFEPDNIHAFLNVPLSAIWPAYDLGNRWNTYYFYNNRPYILNDYGDFTLIPYGASTMHFSENKVPMEIYTTNDYPKVLLVKYNGLDAGFIGMIRPVDTISNIESMEYGCKIGIDFGTCSSTVFYSTRNTDQPKIFKYPQRARTVTKSVHNEFTFWEQFLPYDSTNPDATTIDRYFHTLFRYYRNNPEEAIVDGNIFYAYELEYDKNYSYGGIADNLKWAADKSISAYCAKTFLEQIVIQTLLELTIMKIDIESAEWYFSYPTALSKVKVSQFRSNTESVIESCYSKILNKNINHADRYRTMTESVAAARFFLGTNQGIANNLAGGFVSVDIGGGTTDISFWQNRNQKGNYVYQTSVKIASRSLFVEPLRANRHRDVIMESLGLDTNLPADFRGSSISVEVIELSLSKNKEAYKKLARSEALPEMKGFIETISLGVSGLFYYLGMLIKKLKLEKEIDDFSPNIYFGGNGSNIFNWLNSGAAFRDTAHRAELFKQMLKIGSEIDDPVRINISSFPKAEAAGGMVVQQALIEGNENISRGEIILGEDVVLVNGITLKWNDAIDEMLLEQDIQSIDLNNVKQFISAYNSVYKDLFEERTDIIKYNDMLHKQLTNSVKDVILQMKSDKVWNKPVFLSAIEILIKDADKIGLIRI